MPPEERTQPRWTPLIDAWDAARLLGEHRPGDRYTCCDAAGMLPPQRPALLTSLPTTHMEQRADAAAEAGEGDSLHLRSGTAPVHPDDRMDLAAAFIAVTQSEHRAAEVIARVLTDDERLYRLRRITIVDLLDDPEVGVVVIRTRAVEGAAAEPVEQDEVDADDRAWHRSEVDVRFVLDAFGTVVDVHGPVDRMLGCSRDELIGVPVRDLLHQEDASAAGNAFLDLLSAADRDSARALRHRLRRHDGTYVWTAATLRLDNRSVDEVRVVSECRDISAQVDLEQQLEWQANHDLLTGLLNRTAAVAELERAIEGSRREGRHAAVVFIDLDNFKNVNDTLGHDVGGQLITSLTARLSDAVRPEDRLARHGGDEFLLVCRGIDGPDTALDIAHRLRSVTVEPVQVGDQTIEASASIGVAIDDGDADPNSLVRDADVAMYEAKRLGRNRVELFDGTMRHRLLSRLQLERDLRDALLDEALDVHYHAVHGTLGGELYGFEALVRWTHPTSGMLTPGAFLPVAAAAGLLPTLDRWVLRRALEDMREHFERPDVAPTFGVGVNFSGSTLSEPGCVDHVLGVLETAGIEPRRLVVEITESELMENVDVAVLAVRRLRDAGVRVALDDFGTGYSSLTYLRLIDVDFLKLDRSFMSDVGRDHAVTVIVESIVTMAHRLGLHVVAEGIEDARQLETARELGITAVQGYLFGRSAPVHELRWGSVLVG